MFSEIIYFDVVDGDTILTLFFLNFKLVIYRYIFENLRFFYVYLYFFILILILFFI